MIKHLFRTVLFANMCVLALSCSTENEITDINNDARKVKVDHLSPEMEKVKNYVPPMAVIAHRGSIFWTPEETEASYRWAREMGADYLESDLQCTKDGVILALHDDNLKRTTNIQAVYGEDVPSTRLEFYIHHGMSEEAAKKQISIDKANFVPFYAKMYFYDELAKLDAGTYFNNTSMTEARKSFSTTHLYVSTLEDQINYARGNKLCRDKNGERMYSISGIFDPDHPLDCLKYKFEYVKDDQDTGNRPGVYIEFKEAWLSPNDFEERVYNKLDELGMNIITKPESENAPFYINGKVNVGNTNGKVILQTFSLDGLVRAGEKFQGKVPMCFLLWEGSGATDLKYDDPQGYANFINLAISNKAHIIGPAIAGPPNDYPEMDRPWQHYLIHKAGMLNHPYTFDTHEQMCKYFGEYNYGVEDKNLFNPPYFDGLFTNRSDLSLQYLIDKGVRKWPAPQVVPDPNALLDRLGYIK
jgi:glycerophosphoryl diester phosphodiesterase